MRLNWKMSDLKRITRKAVALAFGLLLGMGIALDKYPIPLVIFSGMVTAVLALCLVETWVLVVETA